MHVLFPVFSVFIDCPQSKLFPSNICRTFMNGDLRLHHSCTETKCVCFAIYFIIFFLTFFCLYLIWISKEEGEEKQDYISLWYFTFTKYLFDKIVYKILQIHLFIAVRNFDCAHFLSSPYRCCSFFWGNNHRCCVKLKKGQITYILWWRWVKEVWT